MSRFRGMGFAWMLLGWLVLAMGCEKDTLVGKDGIPMVRIPGGTFLMGSPPGEGESDEHPRHPVVVETFYIDVHEVTNGEYQRFLDATGRPHAQGRVAIVERFEEHPVVWVHWEDAQAYCEWVGERLPTEAEWEKAARGGLLDRRYPWGDESPEAGGRYRANYAPDPPDADGHRSTAPAESFAPNAFGIYDMAGNVWEWCADWYDRSYYAVAPAHNPQGPGRGSARVIRGGSWDSPPDFLRVAYRGASHPLERSASVGFRCVRDE